MMHFEFMYFDITLLSALQYQSFTIVVATDMIVVVMAIVDKVCYLFVSFDMSQ